MRKYFALTVLALACTIAAYGATPKTKTQKLVNKIALQEPMRGGVWGVLAVNEKGDTIAKYNSNIRMLPASNTKLLTTGMALKALGAEYRYETQVGYSGKIIDGVLYGDIYIIGSGDPTLGADYENIPGYETYFEQWKGFLDAAGIRSVHGNIIGDPRYFDGQPESSTWTYDDMLADYGTGTTGLNFAQNAQRVLVSAGDKVGDPFRIEAVFPKAPWMIFTASGKTTEKGSGSDLSFYNTDFGPYSDVRGHFAIDRKPRRLSCSNRFGAYTCAYYFHNYLMRNGMETAGYADVTPEGYIRTNLAFVDENRRASSNVQMLGSTYSPALKDIVLDTNHESDNFFAETLLHTIGKVRKGSSTYWSSFKAAEEVLSEMGLSYGNCRQDDGSGLSRENYITPDFFVSFLKAMARQDVFEAYLESLPQPGKWGTLDDRLADAPQSVKDRIHMKSGTLSGVRCFSGYLMSSDGKPEKNIEFSILTNNMVAGSSAITRIIESILVSLAAEN